MVAKELSKKLNTRHEFIKLNNFFDLEDEWYKLYGPTTHLNGHYQIEFFKNLLNKFEFYKIRCLFQVFLVMFGLEKEILSQ